MGRKMIVLLPDAGEFSTPWVKGSRPAPRNDCVKYSAIAGGRLKSRKVNSPSLYSVSSGACTATDSPGMVM